MIEVVFLVKRNPAMSQEEFTSYWIDQHTPLTAQTPGMLSYRCYPMIAEEGDPAPFEAVAICTFESLESWQAAVQSAAFKAAVADARNFQDTEATKAFLAREYVIPVG